MKNKQKQFFLKLLLIAIILSIIVSLISPVWADVGNFNTGDSDYDSSGDGSILDVIYLIIYLFRLFAFLGPVNSIILIIVICIGAKLYANHLKKTEAEQLNKPALSIEIPKVDLTELKTNDENFNEHAMLSFAEKVFIST